jgi:hypothetical protein
LFRKQRGMPCLYAPERSQVCYGQPASRDATAAAAACSFDRRTPASLLLLLLHCELGQHVLQVLLQ